MTHPVPPLRVRRLNDQPVNRQGRFVVYWMVANRRTSWNFSLQQTVEHARRLKQPLLIVEALRCGYQWASDRLHRFVIQGMDDNRRSLQGTTASLLTYVEPEHGHGQGLIEELARHASVIVTDDFPCFFIPRMLAAVASRLPVCVEAIDSNGLLPLRAADRTFTTAHAFRRWLHKELPPHLLEFPHADPLAEARLPQLDDLPRELRKRWPEADGTTLTASPDVLAALPIDHQVRPAIFSGGSIAAQATLKDFLTQRLSRYGNDRNQPDADAASGLSPWLHFGHISTHEVFDQLARHEGWSPANLSSVVTGSREGWWGMSPDAESFLDELVTWREVGFNMCSRCSNYDQYESLPDWARTTIEEHAADPRPWIYSCEQLAAADTHDELWNAAQRQLVREGRMHNYLRMLWGKKIYEWSPTAHDALRSMIELNNRYAVDGRNPNSYSGIFWCLGRYDRAWGPERKVFGKLRYMTSENTARKLSLKNYLRQYGS